jgi:hypothetical protein
VCQGAYGFRADIENDEPSIASLMSMSPLSVAGFIAASTSAGSPPRSKIAA